MTFDTQDVLEDKIDRLTVMISKLAMKDGGIKNTVQVPDISK